MFVKADIPATDVDSWCLSTLYAKERYLCVHFCPDAFVLVVFVFAYLHWCILYQLFRVLFGRIVTSKILFVLVSIITYLILYSHNKVALTSTVLAGFFF